MSQISLELRLGMLSVKSLHYTDSWKEGLSNSGKLNQPCMYLKYVNVVVGSYRIMTDGL